MSATAATPAVATVIHQQIGTLNLMRCGAHNFGAMKNGLQFNVGGRLRYVTVILDSSDTYTVTVSRLRLRRDSTYDRVIEYTGSDIYCDQLGEIVGREGDRA